jgi:hypothetical protein
VALSSPSALAKFFLWRHRPAAAHARQPKGRFGTPVAVGTMEGSRFYRDPVCTHILETPRLRGGRVRTGGSRERLLTPLQPTVIHFVSYQSNTISQTASWDVSGSRLLDNVSEIRRLFARSAQVTGNLQKRLPSRGATRSAASRGRETNGGKPVAVRQPPRPLGRYTQSIPVKNSLNRTQIGKIAPFLHYNGHTDFKVAS